MFNGVYVSYVNRSTRDGLEFRLSREQFRALATMDCFYCGSPPSNTRVQARRSNGVGRKYATPFVYNGLDRVSSDFGYTVDNVVACCAQCNFAKHTVSQADFFEWIARVHSNLRRKGLLSQEQA